MKASKIARGLAVTLFTLAITFAGFSAKSFAGGYNTPVVSDPSQVTSQPGLATGLNVEGTAAVSHVEGHDGIIISVPKEDFVLGLKNTFGVSISGNTLKFPAEYNGKKVFVYFYSEPKFASSGVIENGQLSVNTLGLTGNHTAVVFDYNGDIIAKAAVSLGETKIAKTEGTTVAFAVFSVLFLLSAGFTAAAARKN